MANLKLIGLGAAALLAVVVAFAAPWTGGGDSDGRPVLRVGSQKGGAKAVMLASGALEGAGYRIEWSEFPAAQPLLEAIAADAVDLGATGNSPFIFAYASGAKIKAVQASRSSGGGASTALIVRGDSPLHSPADLKGRKVATGRGSIGHYLLLRLMEDAGLAPSDVTVVYLSAGDAKAAFSTGDVDAWATWNPYVAAAVLHDGARVLADGTGVLTGIGYQVASDAAIARRRAELEDFLRRYRQASAWAATHQDEYAAMLSQETGLPLDVASVTASRNRGVPVPLDESIVAEERRTLETFVRAGIIDRSPDLAGAFDASFNWAEAAVR